MGRFKRGGNPDNGQKEIIETYRALGCSVAIVSKVGEFVDLVVGIRGVNDLVEVKTDTGKLRDVQKDLHRSWRGKPIAIIRNVDQVIQHVNHGRYMTYKGE